MIHNTFSSILLSFSSFSSLALKICCSSIFICIKFTFFIKINAIIKITQIETIQIIFSTFVSFLIMLFFLKFITFFLFKISATF